MLRHGWSGWAVAGAIVVLGAALALPAAAQSGEHTVLMRDHFYNPKVDVVEVGTPVVWLNRGKRVHSATSDGGAFNSGRLNPGESWRWTPTEAGSYSYYCTIHLGMRGSIIAYPAGSPPPAAAQTGEETESTSEVSVEWPADGATISGLVNLTGYAVDEAAPDGTGFDRVQVYLDGDRATGRLLGDATYGADRPDIANSLGRPQFMASGFEYTWDPDGATGKHTFYVYAHHVASGEWIGTSVTVTVL